MKTIFLIGFSLLLMVVIPQSGIAADPPHNISCSKCHTTHKASGTALTKADSNVALCLSCHTTGGEAANKALLNSMQAVPGTSGTSHSWSGLLLNLTLGVSMPNSPGVATKIENVRGGMTTVDSSNANSVTYGNANYSANSLVGSILMFFSTTAASSANKYLQVNVTGNNSTTIYWSSSQAMPVNPKSLDRYIVIPADAKLTCSMCHSQHFQARASWDPLSDTTYSAGITNNRHMMRLNNELSQLCEDCHRTRAMSYTRASGSDASYPADGANVFSHPVAELLNSQGYDYSAPLDANGSAQTNSPSAPRRYAGDKDGNPTNNQVLDKDGKIRCMSCHRMHYTDSNQITNDVP